MHLLFIAYTGYLPEIARVWNGEPWDDMEVLTGKTMKPGMGKKKTILFGKCIYQANRDNPDIKEIIAVKGCPPLQQKDCGGFSQVRDPCGTFKYGKYGLGTGVVHEKISGKARVRRRSFYCYIIVYLNF